MPQGSGESHHQRQDVLLREGLLSKKMSSVLDLEKGELPSYGVEDQFSKSNYHQKSVIASRGLPDMRKPGLYTPRNQPTNPSGVPEITQNWAKGVDLNATRRAMVFHATTARQSQNYSDSSNYY
jgi:hypothetical protein